MFVVQEIFGGRTTQRSSEAHDTVKQGWGTSKETVVVTNISEQSAQCLWEILVYKGRYLTSSLCTGIDV